VDWRERAGCWRWELAQTQVTSEQGGDGRRQRSSQARRDEVSDNPTMPRRISHQDDVPVCAGVIQWVLRLGDPVPSGRTQENVRFRERIRALHAGHDGVLGEHMDLRGPARRRGTVWASPCDATDATCGASGGAAAAVKTGRAGTEAVTLTSTVSDVGVEPELGGSH
jgi:hypothetical protein